MGGTITATILSGLSFSTTAAVIPVCKRSSFQRLGSGRINDRQPVVGFLVGSEAVSFRIFPQVFRIVVFS
jgi:hypothetical protein